MLQSNTTDTGRQSDEKRQIDISVIIVSWNVADLLHDCLAALHPQTGGDLGVEVIVVDNASSDDSVAVAQQFSGVRVVGCSRNLGYGRANNLGFRLARGKYCLVLNPDTIPLVGSLAALHAFAESHPRAGIVAPRLLNADHTVQPSAFHFPTLSMALIDLFPPPTVIPGRFRGWLTTSNLNGRYPREAITERPFRIDHPLGAAMLLPREAIEQSGGFDPRLFMYSEEVELALRLKPAGWECWQVPAAQVVHLGGQSTGQMPDKMLIELWRSRFYVARKHRSRLHQVALRTLVAMAQIKRLASSIAHNLLRKQRDQLGEIQRQRALSLLRLALGLRR